MRTDTAPNPEHYIDLDTVQLWDTNYNEGDVGAIFTSIKRYGFNGAIRLWQDNECRAGNHSTMALRLCQQENIVPDGTGCLVFEDRYYVAYISIAHLNETEALAYAIADNNLARMASADEEMLTDYLQRIRMMDATAFYATGFDDDDLNARLIEYGDKSERTGAGEDGEGSDGSLLALLEITIDDPKTIIEPGEVWQLGRHVLVCSDVIRDWSIWKPLLKEGTVFCPYPGPFLALSNLAEESTLVMVQPDPYIAGHICDHWISVKGEDDVRRRD